MNHALWGNCLLLQAATRAHSARWRARSCSRVLQFRHQHQIGAAYLQSAGLAAVAHRLALAAQLDAAPHVATGETNIMLDNVGPRTCIIEIYIVTPFHSILDTRYKIYAMRNWEKGVSLLNDRVK